MSRSRAFLMHLWPSALLLLIIAGFIVFAWYPHPLLQFKDTARFTLMLTLLAAVTGPVLTGLVYKKGKSRLAIKFDLIVIIIIQLTAVAWGSVALYQNRPFFMIFTVEQFEVLSIRDVDVEMIRDKRFLEKPFSGPILLYATMPTGKAFQKLLKEVMLEGKPDLQYRTKYWGLYSEKQELVANASRALNDLRDQRPESVAAIDKLVKKHGGDINQLKFAPGRHQNGEFAAILDAHNGDVIDGLVIDPWIE